MSKALDIAENLALLSTKYTSSSSTLDSVVLDSTITGTPNIGVGGATHGGHESVYVDGGTRYRVHTFYKSGTFTSHKNLTINLTVLQSETNKNQVTSIWKYNDEQHMKTVRSHISKHVKMPNSLSPKEILLLSL